VSVDLLVLDELAILVEGCVVIHGNFADLRLEIAWLVKGLDRLTVPIWLAGRYFVSPLAHGLHLHHECMEEMTPRVSRRYSWEQRGKREGHAVSGELGRAVPAGDRPQNDGGGRRAAAPLPDRAGASG